MTRRVACLLVLLLGGCPDEPPHPRRAPMETPRLSVSGSRHQVGFSRVVRLTARVEGSRARWSLRWRRLFGAVYDAGGKPSAWPATSWREGASLELHTRAAPARSAIAEGQVVPLSAAQAGRVVLELEARAGQRRLSRVVEVSAAYPAAAWPRVAAGVDLYLGGSGWTRARGGVQLHPARVPYLTRARWPASGATGEWNTLAHPARGEPLTLRGGVWLGGRDCGRFDCHPREHRGWLSTAHASVFRRGIEGQLAGPHDPRGPYRDWCAGCHTLGYQPGADNDGFDDRARRAKWTVPRVLRRGNWQQLPAALRERANVQCESCHGPGWFYTGYGVDICAQCHDHPPRYLVVSQLRKNRMVQAQRSVPRRDGQVCAQCHVAREFLTSLRGHRSTSKPDVELDTRRHGVTCAVCHDPHASDCPKQLRLCGEVEIPGQTFDAGQGALCVACHSGEANISRGPLLRPYVPGTRRAGGHGQDPAAKERTGAAAPHAPQFQLLTGRGGKFLRLPSRATQTRTYPHMGVPDSCVHCHKAPANRRLPDGGHSFKLLPDPGVAAGPACASDLASRFERVRRSPLTAPCVDCHGPLPTLNAPARGDYDGDHRLEGLVDEVQGLMELLRREIERQIAGLGIKDAGGRQGRSFAISDELVVVVDGECTPLSGPVTLERGAPLLHKAAHNYLMVLRDGSAGLHNPAYVVRLLQDAIEGLEQGQGRPPHPWKRP